MIECSNLIIFGLFVWWFECFVLVSIVCLIIVIIYKQQSPFGTKIFMDICLRTLSVPRSEQFSKSVAQGKL